MYRTLLAGKDSAPPELQAPRTPLERYFQSQQGEQQASPRLSALDRAIELAPDRPDAWLHRGIHASRSLDERLSDAREAERRGASKRTVALARALAYCENDAREEAQSLERPSGEPEEWRGLDAYLLARLQLARPAWREALATLDRLLDASDLARYERTGALYLRGQIRERLGDRVGAIGLRGLPGARRRIAHRANASGVALALSGTYGTGGGVVRGRAGGGGPRGDLASWQALVDACRKAQATPWSVRVTERALEQHPDSVPLLLARYWALTRQGRHREAVAAAERAHAAAPDDPLALYARGNAYRMVRETWRAWLDLRRASELAPDDVSIHHACAGVLRRLDRYREAFDRADQMIELAPDRATGWASRAATHRAVRERQQALACTERALELDPILARSWSDSRRACFCSRGGPRRRRGRWTTSSPRRASRPSRSRMRPPSEQPEAARGGTRRG